MGVIVARLTGGTDPRTVGSGRTGGTNALRAMGWPRAILVGLLDLAKGAVPDPRGTRRRAPGGGPGSDRRGCRAGLLEVGLPALPRRPRRGHGSRRHARRLAARLPHRRAGLLRHHRRDALRVARLAAGDGLRGRPRGRLRRWPAGWTPPGCSTSCPASPSSGSPIATTSSVSWRGRSGASTLRSPAHPRLPDTR